MTVISLPHDGGWDELLRRAPKAVLEAAFGAIAPGARLDVEPHVAAYRAAGLVWDDGANNNKKKTAAAAKRASGDDDDRRDDDRDGTPLATRRRARKGDDDGGP